VRLSRLRTHDAVLERQLRDDPSFREEWERTALARAVALLIIRHRAKERITQKQLARRLKVSQPWVSRLESGEHDPDLHTLSKLARTLGVEFMVNVKPSRHRMSLAKKAAEKAPVVEQFTSDGSRVLVAAG